MDHSNKDFSLLQTTKNIISNVILFCIEILVRLWYTPYLLRNLGNELFGFIPLANSAINIMGVFAQSLNLSSRRHITIELEKNDIPLANQIFNTTFLGTLLLISVVLPIGIILIIVAPDLFNAPQYSERDVQMLFAGTISAYFLTTIRINFSIATYANNRFDLRNIVSLVSRLIQIGIIVILFNIDSPKLAYVGIGAFTAALAAFMGDIYLWKKLLPDLSLSLKAFRKKHLSPLLGTGSWMLVYQAGWVLYLNVDMLVANRILGLSLAGMYGALLVIPKNIRIMANTVGGVWGPPLLSKYSQADFKGMDKIVRTSIKLIGLTLALPIGFLAGMAEPFLVLWLGPEYETMVWVFVMMIIHLSVNLIVAPFFNVQLSLNKVKIPAIVIFTLAIANGLLMIVLSINYGPLGLAAASALMLTTKNFVFMPIYTAEIMRLAWWHYVKKLLPIALVTLCVSILSFGIGVFYPPTSLFQLLTIGFLISIGYLSVAYIFGLNQDEKVVVMKLFRR